MAIFLNSAEGGTNDATATTANTGGASGTAFETVTAAVKFASAAAFQGAMGYRSSGSTQTTRWATGGSTAVLMRGFFRFTDPTLGPTAMRLALSSGSVAINLLNTGTLGRPQLYMGAAKATGTTPLAANTWYRYVLFADSSAGTMRAAIYAGNTSTLVWDSGLVTGQTIATPTYAMYGKYDGTAQTSDWDEVGLKTGSDAVWPADGWPYVAPDTKLATPIVTVTEVHDVTVVEGTDGQVDISWGAVSGADHYEVAVANAHGATTGFTDLNTNVLTTTYTATGRPAGPGRIRVIAVPA